MLKHILSKLPRKAFKSDTTANLASNNQSNGSDVGGSRTQGKSNAPKHNSSTVFPNVVAVEIEPTLAFKDVASTEKMNLFMSKVKLCCVTFDYCDPSKNATEKDTKRQMLIELIDFVSLGPPSKFTEPTMLAVCSMCGINLFRVFPPNYRGSSGGGENDDDDEPIFDPAWPHLQVVYELLLKFITCSSLDAKLAKKYIDQSFILKLIDLFDSEDPRERECLKTILHRIYGKFMVHRPFIRKAMSNVFYEFVFESERHNGMAELLEIFGSVVSGFALPLKEEHRVFLIKVLVPLHKPKCVGVYFQQLSYCVIQFVEKDPKLAGIVIKELLKYWPVTNTQKEVMFLNEFEEILDVINLPEFQKIMVPLFLRIGSCINSSHFQVAERALFLWHNDQILNLIGYNRQHIIPVILPALEMNAKGHWNRTVLNLTLNVIKTFQEMDEGMYEACRKQRQEDESKISLAAEQREATWKRLEQAANLSPKP